MTRRKLISTTAILAALVSSGCRTRHLGPDTGSAYRAAFDAQRDTSGDGPRFDADVARGALAARRLPGPTSTRASAGPAMPAAAAAVPWPGATGGITLEAK